jgi:hypothetical protein
MAISIWYWQIIDRIHMSIGLGKNPQLYGVLIGQLTGMKDIQSDLVPKGKITVSKEKYVTRLGYYPADKKRKIAELEMGSTKTGHMYFRLGLYPSKFRPGEFTKFREQLELLFQLPYDLLFQQARVSYLELAADSLTYNMGSFIPFHARINHSKMWKSKDVAHGTLNLCSLLSKKRFCFYDKAKQLTESGCPGHEVIRTRIEARLRHIGMSTSEIPEKLPNPFASLEIADVLKARKVSDDPYWQSFLDQCLYGNGSATALSQCSKSTRKEYVAMLRASRADWWKPDFLWKGLGQAMAVVSP